MSTRLASSVSILCPAERRTAPAVSRVRSRRWPTRSPELAALADTGADAVAARRAAGHLGRTPAADEVIVVGDLEVLREATVVANRVVPQAVVRVVHQGARDQLQQLFHAALGTLPAAEVVSAQHQTRLLDGFDHLNPLFHRGRDGLVDKDVLAMLDGLQELKDAGCKVTSIHPMYGPDTRLLSGRHLIVCDVGVPEATRDAKELFGATMVEQLDMSL